MLIKNWPKGPEKAGLELACLCWRRGRWGPEAPETGLGILFIPHLGVTQMSFATDPALKGVARKIKTEKQQKSDSEMLEIPPCSE